MRFAPVTFTGIALSREMFVSNTLELDDAAKTAIEHQADALIGVAPEKLKTVIRHPIRKK